MSETIEFLKWKEAFKKALKVNLRKTNVMVSSGIIKDGLCKSKVDPCWVCSIRVKHNSAMSVQCGKLIHRKWARVNRVTPKFSRNFACKI